MKCPKCDFDNPTDTYFCGKCGTQLFPSEEIPLSKTKTLQTPIRELTTGSTFVGRYQVIEELGRGGMGRVYKVLDKKIKEKVALKLLKPEIAGDEDTIERFSNELKFARKIGHRNVCRMYDLGEEEGTHYITMEYVSGEDLKSFIRRSGQLSVGKAISIARQVCEGLAEAHRLGVVHRDLKPQNIMIDREGNARIMDFGIARSLEAKGITDVGVMIGTPEYMSPEQVEGKKADQRSDIYSLGVILYEMLTGRVPFEGDTPLSIALKHKTEAPPDPQEVNAQIPEDLSQLILRCMEKDKERRYQGAEQLLSDLSNIEKGIPTTKRVLPNRKAEAEKIGKIKWKNSIAVLPLADLSPQKDQEYFCDGMTDDIIAKLTRVGQLKVISRTSVMRYKNTDKDIKEIGQELGVATVLEGSIQKEKDKIRVNTQLINVEDGFHLWAETYDRKLESVFDIQDEISKAIAEALRIKLVGKEKDLLLKRYTENLEAYTMYLKGRYFWNKRSKEEIKKAIEYFKKATEIDPLYALAYAGIADAYSILGFWVFLSPKETFPKAKAAAMKALEIDDMLAEAHASLAFVKVSYDWDWEGAEREFQRAIELNPNYPTAHQWYGTLYLLKMSRLDEAMAEVKRGLELDPLSPIINYSIGACFFYFRQYDQAIEELQRMLVMEPNFPPACHLLFWSYLEKEMYDKAIVEYMKVGRLWFSEKVADAIEHAYQKSGFKAALQKALDIFTEESYWSRTELARLCVRLGKKDEAFDWLEKGFEEREPGLLDIKIYPVFDSLRSDPRFIALLKKMGLDK